MTRRRSPRPAHEFVPATDDALRPIWSRSCHASDLVPAPGRVSELALSSPDRNSWIERVDLGDPAAMRRLGELARAIRAEGTWPPGERARVLVGAERDAPLHLLIDVLDAVAGPECATQTDSCLFLDRVLQLGSPGSPRPAI